MRWPLVTRAYHDERMETLASLLQRAEERCERQQIRLEDLAIRLAKVDPDGYKAMADRVRRELMAHTGFMASLQ